MYYIFIFFSWAQGIKVHMERYTPLVTYWIWLTLLETNTLHTSPQVQHTQSKLSQFNIPPPWLKFNSLTVKLWLRKVSNNWLFTAESNIRLKKSKEMITNLKELLIFNYILLVKGMFEIYTDVRVYMVHFSFLSLR